MIVRRNFVFLFTIVLLFFASESVYAVFSLGDLSNHLAPSFTNVGKLIVAIAYISGIGFGIAAVYKFKQYKDNPTQIPIGTPFALAFVSIILVFFPAVVRPAAQTILGTTQGAAGFEGDAVCHGLPGGSRCD